MAQINKPSDYFNTILWTGDGTSSQPQTGVGFQPDWVWIKTRSTTGGHQIFDVIRGATEVLSSDTTSAESTNTDSLKSFDSDGFTLGGSGGTSFSGRTYVGWSWLADNTSGSSNTDGSITSSVSANTTSGFSIVSYTGTGANATVGHGLSSAPKMIIFKNTNSVRDWGVYHGSLSDPDNYLTLNQTYAQTTGFNFSNNTAPTSSVFSVGTLTNNNGSSQNYIAYCFAEKKGFSKFGSYTGNGNADGTFVYTGFRPAFVIFKKSSSANDWIMKDSVREPNNQMAFRLKPNSSNAEDSLSGGQMDFLSNGFKFRVNDDVSNASGGTYIYMAFAENPLVGTNNIPATAR